MERLDKLVASRACVSRKEARSLIRGGAVRLGGVVVLEPDRKCAPEEKLHLLDRVLDLSPHLYLMLNKPRGVLSATRDAKVPTVLDLVPEELRRKGLFPAGRLDKESEGFVLITDDGALAHRMLAPKYHVPKTYRATLDRPVPMAELRQAFSRGMVLGEEQISPAKITLLEQGPQPLVEVVIHEGIYHQVRRMFAAFSLEVLRLRRVRIGGLSLDESLESGGCRALAPDEVALLLQREG